MIVLAVNAHYISLTLNTLLLEDGFVLWPLASPDPWAALALAVSAMTLLTLPVMWVLAVPPAPVPVSN